MMLAHAAGSAGPSSTSGATPGLLDAAIERGGLHPFFQAQVALDESVVGAEALARIATVEAAHASPAPWLALAERLDRIDALTFVMARSVAQRAQAFLLAGAPLPVSVNVSPMSLARPGFVDRLGQVMADVGASCSLFTLEITDRVATHPSANTRAAMAALRDMGFRIAADDFGAGYAPVDRLSDLPFTEVKIDGAFIKLAMDEAFARKALDACIDIAAGGGLRIVAKGIETPEMWDFVQDLGVDAAQGFLLHRPMPADAFEAFLTGLSD
jgi:EAL domain-containing protein (putative c-di-GMP-specific phosphodiesterase class I)